MRKKTVLKIAKISIFAALSIVLYFLRFPLPPFPGFLKIQFSNLPAIIGGFVLGPVNGLVIVFVKSLISLPFSSTQGIGELADFLIGGASVISSALVYKKIKTKKGGVIALIVGCLCWVGISVIANKYILLPYYMKVFHMTNGDIANLLKALPWSSIINITEGNATNAYILICTIPFNLFLSVIVSFVTFIVYKRVSNIFKKFDGTENEE